MFKCTTRHVRLTKMGETFLANVRMALDGLEGAVLGIADLAACRTGTVTCACVPLAVAHVLPATLTQFRARYPRIRERIQDESAQDVLNLVLRGEADFGINFAGGENPEIEFAPVHVEHYVLVMAHDHRLAGSKVLSWQGAVDERYISVAKSSGNRSLIDAALAGSGKHPVIFCEVNHVAGVLALVQAGLGVAAVPALSVPPGREDGLVAVPLVNPEIKRTLGLISKRGHSMAPAARALFEMLGSTLSKPA